MTNSLDRTFSALSDPLRRALLADIARGERSIGQLAEPHRITLSGVMKHLGVLEAAGLIQREKRGRTVWCSFRAEPLDEAMDWSARCRSFWAQNLDSLAAHLAGPEANKHDS